MGRVTVFDNPLDLSERREHAHAGPLIDWLLTHYPGGFPGAHLALFNLKRLAVADYDRVLGERDQVALIVAPGVPAALFGGGLFGTIAAAVVNAVIAVGLNWAINALFGPKAASPRAPKAIAGIPAAGSVYNLSIPQNTARIGQPIPVAYGKNLIVPDQAMQPYSYYADNEQYVCQLMCVGQGEFAVEDVYIAMSEVDQLASGVFTYWLLGPDDHAQTFGSVYSTTGIWENVYTSPEVADQELFAAAGGSYTGSIVMWNADGDSTGFESYTSPAGCFWLTPAADEYAEGWRAGRDVYLTVDSGPNAGTYDVTYLYSRQCYDDGNCNKPDWIGRKGFVTPLWTSSNVTSTCSLSYADPDADVEGGPVGPFAASPACWETTKLEYDIVFPGGCYSVDGSGQLDDFTVSITFTAEPIDEDGELTGGANQTYEYSETFRTNTPQRRTLVHTVPKARYRVTAARTSDKSDQAADRSDVYWTGLKSYLGTYCDSTDPVYGEVTLLAVRIKATQGLASEAHTRVSVRATRKLAGTATRAPIAAFEDIYTNTVYGPGRPTAELDAANLAAVAAEVPDCTFDAIFDQRSTVWEALTLSVQMIRGLPITTGGLLGVVRDKPHNVPVAGFNEDNVANLSRAYLFAEAGDFDGVEGEYVDPRDGSRQYVLYPATAVNPEPMTLWGCTSRARAQCFVQLWWAQRRLRRRLTTFETELDAHVISVGDPINITHSLLGEDAVLHVVSAVRPQDQYRIAVEAYVYEPDVWS